MHFFLRFLLYILSSSLTELLSFLKMCHGIYRFQAFRYPIPWKQNGVLWFLYWLYSVPSSFQVSVQFSCSVVSDSLRPHEPQHARPPCPSPTPRVHPNPCPLSWWCHPTISSSVVPFFSCPQSFPTSWSFPMSQLFASGGQSIGVSASTSVLLVNTQDWSPLGWRWLDLLAVQATLKSLFQHHSSKASILQCSRHQFCFETRYKDTYIT